MLAIAGQTAWPNWLNFFQRTNGHCTVGKQKSYFFFRNLSFFKIPQATPGTLASKYYI